MKSSEGIAKEDYVRIWRFVLVGWLGWSDERFSAFVHWQERPGGGFQNPMGVLHEAPMIELIGLVVPDSLRAKEGMRVGWDFVDAAGNRIGYEDHDWAGAKERVAALFAKHGYSIPDNNYVSDYERRIRKEA